jgi:peptidyl-prolyl cis-trans isomerase SurA
VANFLARPGVKLIGCNPWVPSEGVKYPFGPSPPFARKPASVAANTSMKKYSLVLVALMSLPSLAIGQADAPLPSTPKTTKPAAAPASAPAAAALAPSGQTVEEIITRVNNQVITRSEFQRNKDQLRDQVKQENPKDPDAVYAEREKDILRDIIDQDLLLDKGKDLGITGDTDLIKRLDQMRKEMKLDTLEDLEKEATKQGVSWEDFKQNMRNQIITQKVIGEEVSTHLSVTKEEEQKFYDDHKSELEQPEAIRLSEILVAPKTTASAADPNAPPADPNAPVDEAAQTAALSAAEAKANDLLKQLRAGAAFEDVAKKFSDGPSAADGGNLGSFERGKLAKQIEDTTFALKSGEITDVIRTKQGFVILKVVDHQMAGIPPIKDVQSRIQDQLYYQKLQPALRVYLTKLREDAYIKYGDGYIDTGMSPNQTQPVETAALKEADAKKLGKKKHKKLGFL